MDKEKANEKVKEFFDSLTPEQLKDLQDDFKNGIESYKKENIEKLTQLKSEKELLLIEKQGIPQGYESWDEKQRVNGLILEIDIKILTQENIVICLENNGIVIDITDQNGIEYKSVPDFRKVDTNEFNFDESNVLILPVPKYVPLIDEERFAGKSFVFDSIRVTEDSYLISVNGYKNGSKETSKESNSFVIVTLDQLVLIIDYYYTKAKANNIAEAKRRTQRSEEHYDSLSEGQRYRYLFQKGIYKALPVAVRKKITEPEWELLDLAGRELLYKPFKTYGSKRLVSKLDEHHMGASFHYMYEDFINKDAITVDKNGNPDKNSRNANPIVWKYWKDFREMINFKIKDIKIQRQDYSDTYKQAVETSFGESNVDPILKEKYGILVKRQNGDKVKPFEVDQIETAWIQIQTVFGHLKPNALKYNLKISHSGEKLMFAMKALGVYIPQMGTIGVSAKLGDSDFRSTFSHESAHFIDNFIGELNGKRWETDNYESTAGKLAFAFRNKMNKSKDDQSDYINATKECFARAFQQYFCMKIYGEDAITMNVDNKISTTGIEIHKHPNFVNKFTFQSEISPMIEQFLKENLDVFETTVDIDGTNNLAPITEEQEVIEEVSDETTDNKIKVGLEFYEYFEPVKRRVVKVTDKLVFSVPVTESDDYQFKSVFKLDHFKEILSKQDEFESEINESESNRVNAESKKSEETQKESDFKKAVSSFVKGDLEIGKAIKSLDQVHKINGELDTLKNHIEKFVSEIKDPIKVNTRDIDGKPHFSENKMSYTPLVNRSGEKYFKYLLSLKQPTQPSTEKQQIEAELEGLNLILPMCEGSEKEQVENEITGLKLILEMYVDEFESGGELGEDFITHELKSTDVETGKKITFWSLHTTNKQGTKNYGSTFGQNIEPDGRYIVSVPKNITQLEDNNQNAYHYSFTTFENPIVLEHKSTDDKGWKKDLSDMFGGKTKKMLSKAIVKKGYDGIITTDGNWVSEIVSLKSFQ